jgi:hypothetical protein
VPEVSNELIYETLKKLHEQMSLVREDVRGVREVVLIEERRLELAETSA